MKMETSQTVAKSRTVALVLIVRNEERGIREVVPKIPLSSFDQCFAMDGNSNDGTVAALQSFGIPSFCQVERGLGAAMIESRPRVAADSFIFFHPDGNEDPGDLLKMADLLRAGHDFVVASRMIKGAINEDDARWLKWRKWANIGFAMLANLAFARGQNRTTDVTNGFRGVSCDAWDRMRLTSKDLTMDYQMVIRALKLDIPIVDFPTHEGSRVCGETNFASLPTGIAELKLLWRELKMGRRSALGPAPASPGPVAPDEAHLQQAAG
jgi:glycosyltransferase involved in cell wall biosynthesis